LQEAIDNTSQNSKLNLILALSYSSKWEITEAIKHIASDTKEGKLSVDKIDENTLSTYLNTKQFPDPELMIRTSGEQRISNFLLWQLAYSELYFTETLWPDFREDDFFKAIISYQQRERRFGKTSEQITA
jgi:undecaprenyl diphosphate synthase